MDLSSSVFSKCKWLVAKLYVCLQSKTQNLVKNLLATIANSTLRLRAVSASLIMAVLTQSFRCFLVKISKSVVFKNEILVISK